MKLSIEKEKREKERKFSSSPARTNSFPTTNEWGGSTLLPETICNGERAFCSSRSMAQNEYEIRGSSLFSGTVRGSKLNFARPQSLPHRKNIRLPEIRKWWTTLTFCAPWFLEGSARIHSTLSIPFPSVYLSFRHVSQLFSTFSFLSSSSSSSSFR